MTSEPDKHHVRAEKEMLQIATITAMVEALDQNVKIASYVEKGRTPFKLIL